MSGGFAGHRDSPKPVLIVNADDLGMSPGVNRGVFEAYDEGLVSSASLMVLRPDAEEAARGAHDRPDLGLGLHLDLGSWDLRDGQWTRLDDALDLDDPRAIDTAISAQVERFVRLVGMPPTHLDSHQHLHLGPEARGIATAWSERLGVPLRGITPGIRTCGAFYGQDRHGSSHLEWVSVEYLARILRTLEGGVTELCCHPGHGSDAPDGYRRERSIELETLSAPEPARIVLDRGIQLRSFANWHAREGEHALHSSE